MRNSLLFCILLLLLTGCDTWGTNKPVGLIATDSMIGILVDIHVADALVEQRHGQDKPNLPLTTALYQQIFSNHHITAVQYQQSYHYYEKHPAIMDKMYETVITELSKKEAQMK